MNRATLTAVAIGIAALGLLVAACGNDDGGEPLPSATDEPDQTTEPTGTTEPTATNTVEPAATATNASVSCPGDAAACEFALRLDQWMTAGDVQSMVAASTTSEFECPDPNVQGAGGPYPLCDDAKEGDLRNGYQVAMLQSEGAVIDASGLAQLLTDWLASVDPAESNDFGTGEVQIVTFRCPVIESGEAICTGDFGVSVSAITTPSEGVTFRQVLVFGVDRSGPGNEPRIRTVLRGRVQSGNDFGGEFLEGGASEFSVILAQGLPKAEFFVWAP